MYTQISIENTTSQANKYEDLLHWAFIRIQRSEILILIKHVSALKLI